MSRLADLVQRAFSVLLLLAFALGLALPVPAVHPAVVPVLLGTVLFLAVARITSRDLASVGLSDLLGFYALRFVALPLGLWAVARVVWPEGAVAVLLFGLLPTGVTTTAVTAILQGNPAIALAATVLSTAIAPLAIPLAFLFLADGTVGLDPRAVGVTLLGLLFLPTALWFGVVRHIRPVADVLRATGGPLSVGLICTIALLVASAQRARVLEAPGRLGALLVLGLLLYGGLYAMGLAWGARADGRARRAWALASGNSNIVLGLTLALLHLPEHAVTFLAWDLAWILALSAIQPVLRAMVPAGGEPWPGP